MAEPQPDDRVTMKPMLGLLVKEAVKLALIDTVLADGADAASKRSGVDWGETADRLRAEWTDDVYSIPDDLFAGMDPMALAQNVAVRLLAPGGWSVNGVYGGNATPRDLFEATFTRPDQDHIAELAFDMDLKLTDPEPEGEAG